jgi:hypothetical protein
MTTLKRLSSHAYRWTAALGLSLLLVVTGCGGENGSQEPDDSAPPLPTDELAVENPWVRPAAAGGNSALYLTVLNGTSSPDTLLDVSAPIIGSVQFHETVDSAGTMHMQPLGPSLPVPPKTRTALEPGGKHVMLMNLSQPLSAGESVVLNLDFAESGLLRLRAPIRMEPPSSNDG